MKLLYFASIREQIGLHEEDVALPAHIVIIADLIEWMQSRGAEYQALRSPTLRVAINQAHVKLDANIADATEIAFFPPMTGG